MSALPPERIALVVHPTRPIAQAVDALQRWADKRGVDLVQIHPVGSANRQVAPRAEPQSGDLIVALGGDGTVLSALRASATVKAPVLGAACGSLGVLTAVADEDVGASLERVYTGDWTPRPLPALAIRRANAPDAWAVNDFVAVRRGAGQLVADVSVDGELYVRLAGDGVIVATELGSTGYSMAAGGPVLAPVTAAFVFTPLAMHGGNAPPLVIPDSSTVQVVLHPGFAGFDIELDGHNQDFADLDYTIALEEDKVTLVSFGGPPDRLTGLRSRRLITDSARILARDDRSSAELFRRDAPGPA
jgi:NAD+ kinase